MNSTEWLIENGRYHTIGKDIIFSINTKDMEQYAEYVHNERSKLHLDAVVGRSEQLARKSCDHACSPSDYYKGGKCDKMGCY